MTAFHATAIPQHNMKKKLLNGLLLGRDRVQQEVEKSAEQERLL